MTGQTKNDRKVLVITGTGRRSAPPAPTGNRKPPGVQRVVRRKRLGQVFFVAAAW